MFYNRKRAVILAWQSYKSSNINIFLSFIFILLIRSPIISQSCKLKFKRERESESERAKNISSKYKNASISLWSRKGEIDANPCRVQENAKRVNTFKWGETNKKRTKKNPHEKFCLSSFRIGNFSIISFLFHLLYERQFTIRHTNDIH